MPYTGRPEYRKALPYGARQDVCVSCIYLQSDNSGFFCPLWSGMKIMSPAFHRCPHFKMSVTVDTIKPEVEHTPFAGLKGLRQRHGLNPKKPIITEALKGKPFRFVRK